MRFDRRAFYSHFPQRWESTFTGHRSPSQASRLCCQGEHILITMLSALPMLNFKCLWVLLLRVSAFFLIFLLLLQKIEPSKQRIIFGGQILRDEKSIKDYSLDQAFFRISSHF